MQSIAEFETKQGLPATASDWARKLLRAAPVDCTVILLLLAALLTGCADFTAKPIAPASTATVLERRTLHDPGLVQFIAAASPAHAGGAAGWDTSTLTLAALYYHPEDEISRTQLTLSKAGIRTAGQIPNPTLSVAPGSGVLASQAPSPVTIGVLISFVIETFGKRPARMEQARHLAEAARQDLATAAWQVRGGVRTALLDLWSAEGRLRLAQRRRGLQEQVVNLLERRFTAGESSALDVARERINLSQVTLAARDAERQGAEARARLAAAIGVPVRAMNQVRIELAAFDKPMQAPDIGEISEGSLRRRALLERPDVLGLLSEYEAAQAALRLEIAKQYPNINVGPGYAFDRGDSLYNFELSIDLPVFNQNQGHISEAEARRKAAAAKLAALQARIIGDIDRAVAAYRGGARTLATADVLLQSQVRRRQQLDRPDGRG